MKGKQKKRIAVIAAVLAVVCIAGGVWFNYARNQEYITYRTLYKDTYKKMADVYIVLRGNGEQFLLDFDNRIENAGAYQYWFTEDDVIATQEDFERLQEEVQSQVAKLAKVPRKQSKIYQDYYTILGEAHGDLQELEALLSSPGNDKKAFEKKLEELEHSIDSVYENIYQGFPVSQKEIGNETFLKLAEYWSANTIER